MESKVGFHGISQDFMGSNGLWDSNDGGVTTGFPVVPETLESWDVGMAHLKLTNFMEIIDIIDIHTRHPIAVFLFCVNLNQQHFASKM